MTYARAILILAKLADTLDVDAECKREAVRVIGEVFFVDPRIVATDVVRARVDRLKTGRKT